jgi:1,4-dihydroxy-2-naphthoyl-CoA synthase
VTLDRPEVENAIDPPMHDELCRIGRDFRDDDAVDVAIDGWALAWSWPWRAICASPPTRADSVGPRS